MAFFHNFHKKNTIYAIILDGRNSWFLKQIINAESAAKTQRKTVNFVNIRAKNIACVRELEFYFKFVSLCNDSPLSYGQ